MKPKNFSEIGRKIEGSVNPSSFEEIITNYPFLAELEDNKELISLINQFADEQPCIFDTLHQILTSLINQTNQNNEELTLDKIKDKLNELNKNGKITTESYQSAIHIYNSLKYSVDLSNIYLAPLLISIKNFILHSCRIKSPLFDELIKIYGKHLNKIDWQHFEQKSDAFFTAIMNYTTLNYLLSEIKHERDSIKDNIKSGKKRLEVIIRLIKENRTIEIKPGKTKDKKYGIEIPVEASVYSDLNDAKNTLQKFQNIFLDKKVQNTQTFWEGMLDLVEYVPNIIESNLINEIYNSIPFKTKTSKNSKAQICYLVLQLINHQGVEKIHITLKEGIPTNFENWERTRAKYIMNLINKFN